MILTGVSVIDDGVRRLYIIIYVAMLSICSCKWESMPFNCGKPEDSVAVARYDRLQSLYLTTGDYSAMQQMYTEYPMQTRTLIEDVLKIGRVNDPTINSKFLHFYQDTVLQALINTVEQQYVNMDDINKELERAFGYLRKEIPGMPLPQVYTQIGTLDQSIVVGNNTIGISLDKYLGKDYPLYLQYYDEEQRREMERTMIVPDCLVFYVLSLYSMPHEHELCDIHMGKIMWVVNKAVSRKAFNNEFVQKVDRYMHRHKDCSVEQLLNGDNHRELLAS